MSQFTYRPGFFAAMLTLGGVMAFLAFPDSSADSGTDQPDQAKLVVVVVFDQMRGDYPARWQELYDKDGFGRLLNDGAWYQNCHYPYAYTLTAAGHASMSTGCPPNKHGIIANDWYESGKGDVGVVKTGVYRTVPQLGKKDKDEGAAPVRLKQATVGDGLLKHTNGKAKVVSLSIKDRSAILLAALRATAVYWFETLRGMFVTTTFYRDTSHAWVKEFNNEKHPDKYFGKAWNKLRDDLDYAKYSGPDDVPFEGIGHAQGRVFPHPMTGGVLAPAKKYYEAFTTSPYASEVLLELAKRAIDEEKLGQRDVCDLLCLSFSSNDLIGHCWGPDSQEVLDITLRTDLILKELMKYLDAKVGQGKYVLMLSADHGVMPIPELAKANGKDAGRVPPETFKARAAAYLQEKYAKGKKLLPWVAASKSGWIYLNPGTVKECGLTMAEVEAALAEWLPQQPGIQAAYTRTRLEQGPLQDDPIGEMVRLSFFPEHSGNVAIVLKPYHLSSQAITHKDNNAFRTTHGTPHPYDTHVPLIVYGTGVVPGVRLERVTPLAMAAIAARALQIPPPSGAEYPVPKGLFKD